MKQIIDLLKNIKKLSLYKFFLLNIFKPIYELIWQYLINFKCKCLYYLWFSKKRELIDLEGNDKKLVTNNSKFNELANKIYNFCSKDILVKSKKNILEGKAVTKNPTNSGENLYKQELFSQLDDKIKAEIFELAHSDLMISTSAKYLKVFPIVDKIIVYHNVPNNSQIPRGPMLWHKDDFGYKSLDLFMALTDIDDNNGPLICVKEKNKFGIFSKNKFENVSTNNFSRGERGKISSNFFEEKNYGLIKLDGKKGNSLLIDSFTVYHKGGQCIKNDRLMLRISYQTPDSIRVNKESQKFIDDFKKLGLKLNFFTKFLYYHRPSNFLIFLRNYLMKFYRIIHIKEF